MKVLKGFFKGVPLSVPEGGVVRPTVDHFKKHISRLASEKKPKIIWDLYAGSGGVGIELLSLGAREALFLEEWKKAIEYIKLNLGECNLKNMQAFSGLKTSILTQSAESFLKNPTPYFLSGPPDLVFLDPPYGQNAMARVTPQLLSCPLITCETLIIAEHVVEDPLGPMGEIGNLKNQEIYGPKVLSIFAKKT